MHRFTHPEIPKPAEEFALDADQSHHLARVLRVEEGETVEVLDGRGSVARAVVQSVRPREARLRIESVQTSSRRAFLSVAFSIPKGQALDFVFRRLTELGVESFQPLETRQGSSAKGWNAERWENVVQEVCKQCQEPYFPRIEKPLPLVNWLARRDRSRVLLFCDETDRSAPAPTITSPADLLVGPEGGWEKSEIEAVVAAGGLKFSLGENRLRMETACLVALTLAKKAVGEI